MARWLTRDIIDALNEGHAAIRRFREREGTLPMNAESYYVQERKYILSLKAWTQWTDYFEEDDLNKALNYVDANNRLSKRIEYRVVRRVDTVVKAQP